MLLEEKVVERVPVKLAGMLLVFDFCFDLIVYERHLVEQ